MRSVCRGKIFRSRWWRLFLPIEEWRTATEKLRNTHITIYSFTPWIKFHAYYRIDTQCYVSLARHIYCAYAQHMICPPPPHFFFCTELWHTVNQFCNNTVFWLMYNTKCFCLDGRDFCCFSCSNENDRFNLHTLKIYYIIWTIIMNLETSQINSRRTFR